MMGFKVIVWLSFLGGSPFSPSGKTLSLAPLLQHWKNWEHLNGTNSAPEPSMEAHNLYLAACWCYSSTCKYAEFGVYWNSSGAAIWIHTSRAGLPVVRNWWEHTVFSIYSEEYICWSFWCSVWTSWSNVIRVTYQLDNLYKQGCSTVYPGGHHCN
ncbi:UNVERIFIED_CONTAM: hypothetical protein Slati_4315700 [Sesamum latifolium]|uniref:Uncharacterized protein n=1 Tax=Sesamum latifolium TaxID=2727402 RepID=A0AAW2SN34_9LAMI